MKVRPGILFLVAGSLAACSPEAGEQAETMPAAEATDVASVEAAIDQVRTDYTMHFNMHDAAAVAGMFADSAVVLGANGAVEEGRDAIAASLTAQMAGLPQAQIEKGETMVFGDWAIDRGTYTVSSTSADGTAMNVAGSYMTALERMNDVWKIQVLVTNFNAPPPAGYPMAAMTGDDEPPPENGTMTALREAYTAAYNGGQAEAVAGLYTDDAVIAFANLPVTTGKAAILAATTEALAEGSPKLEIHDVHTQPLGDGYALDAGWYRSTATTADGEVTQEGAYVLLCRQMEDGSWKIQWAVSNGYPAGKQDR